MYKDRTTKIQGRFYERLFDEYVWTKVFWTNGLFDDWFFGRMVNSTTGFLVDWFIRRLVFWSTATIRRKFIRRLLLFDDRFFDDWFFRRLLVNQFLRPFAADFLRRSRKTGKKFVRS